MIRSYMVIKSVNFYADERYIPTLGNKMAIGRNFSRSIKTDSFAMILKQAARYLYRITVIKKKIPNVM